MRDYVELVSELRESADWADRLAVLMGRDVGDSHAPLMRKAADALEELLADVPPSLWTDEPIEGSEFMTHNQGGRGFEIHFRTDSVEKYRAVQEECRWQIYHTKPEPTKEVIEDEE